ncbi:MAG: hypothetical protein JWL90_3568 [Chthoniobacteraceae bacterium]|nr:hypothetical protein [Chthoniobacteraceae bacterium]
MTKPTRMTVRLRHCKVLALLTAGLLSSFLLNRVQAATYDVDVVDFEFVPSTLVIAPGDTVVWHASAPDHTVTADDLSFDSSPEPDTVTLSSGATFSHTFPTAGINHYYCRIHGKPLAARGIGISSTPDDVMTGVIRVADPSVNTPPETPLNSTPATGSTGVSSSPLLQATAFGDPDIDDKHAASQWLIRIVESNTIVLDSGVDTANLTQLRATGLTASMTYSWQVRYQDDRGAWSSYSIATQFTVTEDAGAGTGLTGTYFAYDAKRDIIKKQVGTRLDPVLDFEWALGKPHPSAPANNFFIYWEGNILPKFSEEYRFRIKADGGVRLWINGQIIINDPVAASFTLYRSGTVALEAGIPATIRIQYFDTITNASMHLRWSSLSQPLEVVPQARLFPTP